MPLDANLSKLPVSQPVKQSIELIVCTIIISAMNTYTFQTSHTQTITALRSNENGRSASWRTSSVKCLSTMVSVRKIIRRNKKIIVFLVASLTTFCSTVAESLEAAEDLMRQHFKKSLAYLKRELNGEANK